MSAFDFFDITNLLLYNEYFFFYAKLRRMMICYEILYTIIFQIITAIIRRFCFIRAIKPEQ